MSEHGLEALGEGVLGVGRGVHVLVVEQVYALQHDAELAVEQAASQRDFEEIVAPDVVAAEYQPRAVVVSGFEEGEVPGGVSEGRAVVPVQGLDDCVADGAAASRVGGAGAQAQAQLFGRSVVQADTCASAQVGRPVELVHEVGWIDGGCRSQIVGEYYGLHLLAEIDSRPVRISDLRVQGPVGVVVVAEHGARGHLVAVVFREDGGRLEDPFPADYGMVGENDVNIQIPGIETEKTTGGEGKVVAVARSEVGIAGYHQIGVRVVDALAYLLQRRKLDARAQAQVRALAAVEVDIRDE